MVDKKTQREITSPPFSSQEEKKVLEPLQGIVVDYISKVHIKARGFNWMISYHLYCLGLNCRIDDLVKKPYCTLQLQLQVK